MTLGFALCAILPVLICQLYGIISSLSHVSLAIKWANGYKWLLFILFLVFLVFFFCLLVPKPHPYSILPKKWSNFTSQAQLPFIHRHNFSGRVDGHIFQFSMSVARWPGGRAEQEQGCLFKLPCWLPPQKTWGKCQGLCPSALQGWTLCRRGFRKVWPCSADGTVLWQPEFHWGPDADVCPTEIPVWPWSCS